VVAREARLERLHRRCEMVRPGARPCPTVVVAVVVVVVVVAVIFVVGVVVDVVTATRSGTGLGHGYGAFCSIARRCMFFLMELLFLA